MSLWSLIYIILLITSNQANYSAITFMDLPLYNRVFIQKTHFIFILLFVSVSFTTTVTIFLTLIAQIINLNLNKYKYKYKYKYKI